jgi:hypothetical protein
VVWAAAAALSASSKKVVSSFFMKRTRSRSCWFEWGDQGKFRSIAEDAKEKVYRNETLSFFWPARSKSLWVRRKQRRAADERRHRACATIVL